MHKNIGNAIAIFFHNIFDSIYLRLNHVRRYFPLQKKFCEYSVAESNPTFAYTIIIFTDRTSAYAVTFTHCCEGHLGLGLLSV